MRQQRSTASASITKASCKAEVPEAAKIDDASSTVPVVERLTTAARRSRLSRFRTGRQQCRRALQAQTQMDLQHMRRYEQEVIEARAHRARHEQQLLQACAVGSITTVDTLSKLDWPVLGQYSNCPDVADIGDVNPGSKPIKSETQLDKGVEPTTYNKPGSSASLSQMTDLEVQRERKLPGFVPSHVKASTGNANEVVSAKGVNRKCE